MKTAPNTRGPIPFICANGHDRIVHYDGRGCPLCAVLTAYVKKEDHVLHLEYEIRTLREAQD
jgi:predicted DCC family thiol-disulfide oxidoreductase YuxK